MSTLGRSAATALQVNIAITAAGSQQKLRNM
jgi:hypothetical protein